MTSKFIPNSFQTPNVYVDQYMAFLTPAEYKVLSYAVRRIFGFQKRQDNISISQFCSGLCNREGEQLDHGTGLGYGTVKAALEFLHECKLVIRIAENDKKLNIGACYTLQLESDQVNWDVINKRLKLRKETNKKRTKNARKVASKKAKESVVTDPLCGTEDLCGTEGGCICGTEGGCICGTEEQYTEETKEKQIGANNKNAPEQNSPIPEGYDVLFNEEENEKQANEQHARTQAALISGVQAQANGAVDLSWLQEHLWSLATAYVNAMDDERQRPIKSDYPLWRKTLNAWFDMKIMPQDITNAVRYMRDNNLTIGGIQSVTKTARDGKGGQEEIVSALPKITSKTIFN